MRVVFDVFLEDFANYLNREFGDIETSLFGWQLPVDACNN